MSTDDPAASRAVRVFPQARTPSSITAPEILSARLIAPSITRGRYAPVIVRLPGLESADTLGVSLQTF